MSYRHWLVLTATLLFVETANAQCVVDEWWQLKADDTASERAFGEAVAIDGDFAVVGARRDDGGGAAYVYVRDGMEWRQFQKLEVANARYFGFSVAIQDHTIVVGDPYAGPEVRGAAWVFVLDGSTWREVKRLDEPPGELPPGRFGWDVVISGDTMAIGAPSARYVVLYRDNGQGWEEEQRLHLSGGDPFDDYGASIAIDGTELLVGAPRADVRGQDSGLVYTYRYDGLVWSEGDPLVPSDGTALDLFGYSLALHGSTAAIAAPTYPEGRAPAGAVYVFRHDSGRWYEVQRLSSPDQDEASYLGIGVDIEGDVIIAGADGGADLYSEGSAQVFRSGHAGWVYEQKLVATDNGAEDGFGRSVSVSDGTLIVGSVYRYDASEHAETAYVFPNLLDRRCRCGAVDIMGGGGSQIVLTVNGSPGTPIEREVIVRAGESVEIHMDAPREGPNPAAFVLYAWKRQPDPLIASPLPFGLGSACLPTFISVGVPKPSVVWNNAGHEPLLGAADRPSSPAPTRVLETKLRPGASAVITLQGIIADRRSRAQIEASVTNAVVVRVTD